MTESFYYSARECYLYCEQVMSPNGEENDDNAPQAQATGHEKTSLEPAAVVIPPAHAMSADSEAPANILKMLSGMNARMQKMEASHQGLTRTRECVAPTNSSCSFPCLVLTLPAGYIANLWNFRTFVSGMDQHKLDVWVVGLTT